MPVLVGQVGMFTKLEHYPEARQIQYVQRVLCQRCPLPCSLAACIFGRLDIPKLPLIPYRHAKGPVGEKCVWLTGSELIPDVCLGQRIVELGADIDLLNYVWDGGSSQEYKEHSPSAGDNRAHAESVMSHNRSGGSALDSLAARCDPT